MLRDLSASTARPLLMACLHQTWPVRCSVVLVQAHPANVVPVVRRVAAPALFDRGVPLSRDGLIDHLKVLHQGSRLRNPIAASGNTVAAYARRRAALRQSRSTPTPLSAMPRAISMKWRAGNR